MVLLSLKSNDDSMNTNEYIAIDVLEEYKTFKQTVRPKTGSLVELARMAQDARPSAIVYCVGSKQVQVCSESSNTATSDPKV
jgi:hypothetical protein